jgi:hypothetical protein
MSVRNSAVNDEVSRLDQQALSCREQIRELYDALAFALSSRSMDTVDEPLLRTIREHIENLDGVRRDLSETDKRRAALAQGAQRLRQVRGWSIGRWVAHRGSGCGR